MAIEMKEREFRVTYRNCHINNSAYWWMVKEKVIEIY